MSSCLLTLQSIYAVFGTSNGHLQLFKLNFDEGSMEESTKIVFKASVLSMKLAHINGSIAIICGLSSGDIIITSVTLDILPVLTVILAIKLAHDFGVNSLDVKELSDGSLCIVSGGDD
jgi:hypothetical protein